MPENTVYVGRPTIYGNPFLVSKWTVTSAKNGQTTSQQAAVDLFREWWERRGDPTYLLMYSERMERLMGAMFQTEPHPLRGKNLACWCSLDQPCHADVLLEIANV